MKVVVCCVLVAISFHDAFAQSTKNDDSCEIGTAPAATLLLPFFEVETAFPAIDTFFTVTNVSNRSQIAHVTIWSDWSFPVLTFNVFITGYDVQSISLYDVIVNGRIAQGLPDSILVPFSCAPPPSTIPSATRTAMQSALVTGIYNATGFKTSCGSTPVGSPAATHRSVTTTVGYITIDGTSQCSSTLPTNPSYFANEILFDNVLTGDYETINREPGNNFASANPMVHIRAIPEGGPAGTPLEGRQTNLPYTFYSRFINGQKIGDTTYSGALANFDRRQPLPSVFAARWIQGGATSFNTNFKIWREGRTGPVTCTTPPSSNANLGITEIVRFDEHENPMVFPAGQIICTYVPTTITFPESSSTSTTSSATYPPLNSPAGDTAGWMYFNLNSGKTFDAATQRASQNWVVVSMTGSGATSGLFGVEFDATHLFNGCSAAILSTDGGLTGTIGPSLVCPESDPKCTPGVAPYNGTNATPP